MKNFYLKYKFYIIYLIVVFFLLFYFRPYQEKFYFKKDIKKFENDYYWKMIFVFIILILLFLIWRIFKNKEKEIAAFLYPVINVTLYLLFLTFIFQDIIISIVLLGNRLIDRNQSEIIYKVEHYKDMDFSVFINETKNEKIYTYSEEDFFNRLEDIRLNKKLKSINQSDSIHIKYNIGLFGIKYLNE